MLEFGCEVAFEIVFDYEDAEEVGVAAGAEDVPGQGGCTESGACCGIKQAECVTPAFGENGPKKNRATAQNDGGGAFCQDRKPEEKSK